MNMFWTHRKILELNYSKPLLIQSQLISMYDDLSQQTMWKIMFTVEYIL
jgi:hypothetical protein